MAREGRGAGRRTGRTKVRQVVELDRDLHAALAARKVATGASIAWMINAALRAWLGRADPCGDSPGPGDGRER